VNPVNKKALSIPILNPFDQYGRTLWFSTMGFMIAFLSWYAFPPLLTITVKKDLNLSQDEIANSNIVALVATLVVRANVGPLCDRFGPRYVFAGILLCGAIPTGLAGTISSPAGLLVIRFFIGILGATFVPCQVWSTGFYDKKVVGAANAISAGIGNAGGGITYFVIPAVFDSLVKHQHLTPHKAWRVTFVVPCILIIATALGMLFMCEDTPTGPWSERHLHIHGAATEGVIVDASAKMTDVPKVEHASGSNQGSSMSGEKDKDPEAGEGVADAESIEGIVTSEIVVAPTWKEAVSVIFSLQCLVLFMLYASSFGGELAINSILGAYYAANFKGLGQTRSGKWAAMFGLLNVLFRPAGGYISDSLYRRTGGSVWAKKLWLHFLGAVMGCMCLCIGLLDTHDLATMIGLVACMAFFMQASNGANFSLVPHVYPFANGIVSGTVGAGGNFGGIIFAIIFRYNKLDYGRSFWIIGVIMIASNLCTVWMRPVPRKAISF